MKLIHECDNDLALLTRLGIWSMIGLKAFSWTLQTFQKLLIWKNCKMLKQRQGRISLRLIYIMPARWLRKDIKRYGMNDLTFLAKRYEVSQQGLWFRLLTLKLVTDASQLEQS